MISKIAVLAIVLSSLEASVSAAPLIYGTADSGERAASTLYSVLPETGAATAIGVIGFDQVDSLAFAPTGTLFGVGQNGAAKWVLLKIDLTTGAGTAVGATGLEIPFRDISFRSDGTLFGYTRPADRKLKSGLVYSINTDTGAATLVGNTVGGVDECAPVAFSSAGALYAVSGRNLTTIGANAGPVTALHYSSALGGSSSQANTLKFDPNTGTLWALFANGSNARTSYLAKIDVKTGDVGAVGRTLGGLRGLAIEQPRNINTVPLPSSLLFLITGVLALLGWNRWMRSRRSFVAN